MKTPPSQQPKPQRLLIAASGTGGHLFPALATAECLADYQIEWLGVPDRLETKLVPESYPLHTVAMGGFQQRFSLATLRLLGQVGLATLTVRRLLQQGQFQGVFTTGGYIAAPAIVAARSLGLPAILHESNALPGKVTRWLSPWCSVVAIGFEAAAQSLPQSKTITVGTPVREQFRAQDADSPLDLPIPEGVPLIVAVGGSQGAVAMNQLVRQSASAWFEAGAWLVHLVGQNDPNRDLSHPQYIALPFYNQMAALLRRAILVISRAGAGSLTELAVTHTPAVLIPFPFAADDHQTFNARVFADAGAALLYRQTDLTSEILRDQVLALLRSPDRLQQMSIAAEKLAITDSAEQLADLIRSQLSQA